MSGFSVQSCIQYFAFISNFSAKHTVVLCWQTFLIGWSPTLRPMREGGRAVKVTRSLTQPTGNSSCLPGPRCSGGGGWVMGKNTFCHTLIRGLSLCWNLWHRRHSQLQATLRVCFPVFWLCCLSFISYSAEHTQTKSGKSTKIPASEQSLSSLRLSGS